MCGTVENKTVHDHSHLDGTYRGAAHSVCNRNEGTANKKNYKIPVFFHNLKGYDAHHIIRSIGEHTTKINVIPQNYERYVTFGYHNLKYLDSFGFLTSGLDPLVKNLYDGGKGTEKFKHTKKISHFLHTTSYIQIAHDTSRIIFFLFL